MNRRQFLKSGLLAGSVVLTGTSLYGCADLDILETELIDDDVAVTLTALLPAFLAGALPGEGQARAQSLQQTIANMRGAIKKFPPHILGELKDLFALLTNKLANLAFIGHFVTAAEFNLSQANQLIESWRLSYLSLLNTAYEGLKELIFAAFYSEPQHWARLNYNKPDLGV